MERLSAIEGIGKVTAAAILALMPELGKIGDKQAAALAGLAPYNRDSGPCKGQRSISGGRSKLRALLYMPALTAVRCNPILKPFYKALKDRGKKARSSSPQSCASSSPCAIDCFPIQIFHLPTNTVAPRDNSSRSKGSCSAELPEMLFLDGGVQRGARFVGWTGGESNGRNLSAGDDLYC